MGRPIQSVHFTWLGSEARLSWTTLGEPRVLESRTPALLCSARCPGGPILRALDLAAEVRDADLTVVGGFHSPVGQDCLTLLLRGTARIVICPAREVVATPAPAAILPALASRWLAVLLRFVGLRRVTARTALARNELVAALADEVLVLHAAVGSGTERLALALLAAGRTVLTPEDPANAALVARGPVAVDSWAAHDRGRYRGSGG